jgi:carboxymethylenebutenolidase
MNDYIAVNGQGGTFTAYIARPKTSPAPAVVVLQELFGVNWRNKDSWRSRQTCFGGRSPAST